MLKLNLPIVFVFLFLFFLNPGFSQEEIYIPFRKGDLWGYADTNRNIVLTPAFEKVNLSKNGLFVVEKNKQQALFTKEDKMLIDFEKHYIYINDKYVTTRIGNKSLIYSSKGIAIFPDNVINTSKIDFNDQTCAIVKTKTGKYGFIRFSESMDKIDQWLLDTTYQEIVNLYHPDFLKVVKDDQVLKYHKDGRIEVIPEGETLHGNDEAIFEFVDMEVEDESPRGNRKKTKSNSSIIKDYFVDGSYKVIIQIVEEKKIIKSDTLSELYKAVDVYSNTEYFNIPKTDNSNSENLKYYQLAFVTNKENKVGIINGAGKLIIPCIYDSIDPNFFPKGCDTPIFSAQKNKKWGLIDLQNKVILDFKYEEAIKNIYRKGPEIRQRRTNCFDIRFGVVVKQNGKYGVVGKSNQVLLPFNYDSIHPNFRKSTFSLILGGKHGLFVNEHLNAKKEIILKKLLIEPIHDQLLKEQNTFQKYRVGVVKDEKGMLLGYLDAKGFYYFED